MPQRYFKENDSDNENESDDTEPILTYKSRHFQNCSCILGQINRFWLDGFSWLLRLAGVG